VIRADKFLISKRLYAVDLASLTVEPDGERYDGTPMATCRLGAVWFRRTSGVTRACIGTLWNIQAPPPADVAEFLAAHDDGRYGGDCDGRWDGENYWGAQKPETIEQHLAILRPMLAAYPAIPPGYDGWWRFNA
jgi:hypothetical protein